METDLLGLDEELLPYSLTLKSLPVGSGYRLNKPLSVTILADRTLGVYYAEAPEIGLFSRGSGISPREAYDNLAKAIVEEYEQLKENKISEAVQNHLRKLSRYIIVDDLSFCI